MIYDELKVTGLKELMLLFEKKVELNIGELEWDLYFTEVACVIARHGEDGILFLLQQLKMVNDNTRTCAILESLVNIKSKSFDPEALFAKYLSNNDPQIKRIAIDGLTFNRSRDAREKVMNEAKSEDPCVMGAFLRYMAELYLEESKPYLVDALRSKEFIVRESAIDIIDELNLKELIPLVIPLLQDCHPHVREAAQWAINHA